MNRSIDSIVHIERLKKRRDQVALTLEHVQEELRALDDNKDSIDHASYKSRADLLASLAGWYFEESAHIDTALDRIAEGTYGVCTACRGSIEARRLETSPAATFCAQCQEMREAPG